ncbi:hypothetical protein B4135_0483 [Caldibacillus debilis]|uniref:Uncharacterized protein n=1 Tax=Caldibacillus debilis TaxID=301148 RepID=A0A150L8Z8_9BACI|nr:hypothetical protein B4135_0483 [Caldibacillus debilis]
MKNLFRQSLPLALALFQSALGHDSSLPPKSGMVKRGYPGELPGIPV